MSDIPTSENTLGEDPWRFQRKSLRNACRRLVEAGLVSGSGGNVSLRLRHPHHDDLVLITARGANLDDLGPHGLSLIDMSGEPVDEELPPSSESALHLGIYAGRPDVGCVVHSHPVYSTVAAVAGREIPPLIDEVVIKIGGPVPVAEYGFPGSEELAEKALVALDDGMAVLLRHHGLITVGRTPEETLENSLLVERLAQIFLYTSLLGAAHPLPEATVELEKELYRMKRAAESADE